MDDMQSRIAARRAQIERERAGVTADDEHERVRRIEREAVHARAEEARAQNRKARQERDGGPEFGAENVDVGNLFEELFADANSPDRAVRHPHTATAAREEGPMQDRIAARRAEVERERATAEAQASAAAQARQAERRAAADREWVERARQKKARRFNEGSGGPKRSAILEAQRKKDVVDQLLREAVRRKWTAGEMGTLGFLAVCGLLLLSSHPVWGTILMLFGIIAYVGTNSKYKEEALRKHPDLFDHTVDPISPPTPEQ